VGVVIVRVREVEVLNQGAVDAGAAEAIASPVAANIRRDKVKESSRNREGMIPT